MIFCDIGHLDSSQVRFYALKYCPWCSCIVQGSWNMFHVGGGIYLTKLWDSIFGDFFLILYRVGWYPTMTPGPDQVDRWLDTNCSSQENGFLCGGLKHFLFSPLLGEMIQFDWYLWNGLKPPTSFESSTFGMVWQLDDLHRFFKSFLQPKTRVLFTLKGSWGLISLQRRAGECRSDSRCVPLISGKSRCVKYYNLAR